ncbi:MAG: type IV pilus biogenesis/stability protein PilW [Pseudomonadota bacterium]
MGYQFSALTCRLLAGLFLLTASGCVTEVTGGLPGPAPMEDRIQAQLDLARGYIEQRDFKRAKAPLAKALDINPRHVETLVLNAVLLTAESEYDIAEEFYKQALSVAPNDSQALNNYGSFLYARGRYEDALVPLSRLVKDTGYRARAQAFENLGFAQLRVNDEQAAAQSFARALELNYRQPRSSLELAYLAYERGDYRTAQSQLISFRAYARPNARSLCLGVKLGAELGDEDMRASNALALKNLYPKQAETCQPKT